ncbi:hypothetical protein M378DRAFT_166538, partial [Amanita muscaria Koide BX008]
MLEVARTIRYIHSLDVALWSACIQSVGDLSHFQRVLLQPFIYQELFFLDSNFRVKFEFTGLFTWWQREASIYGHEYDYLTDYTYESNISAFGHLFHEVCFKGRGENLSNRLVDDALQLINRCRAKDPKSRPTMKDVVTEMETWNL